LIRTLHEGLLADGVAVPLTKLCAWFGVPRRTVYYKPVKAARKVDPRFADTTPAIATFGPFGGTSVVVLKLGRAIAHQNGRGPEGRPGCRGPGPDPSDRRRPMCIHAHMLLPPQMVSAWPVT